VRERRRRSAHQYKRRRVGRVPLHCRSNTNPAGPADSLDSNSSTESDSNSDSDSGPSRSPSPEVKTGSVHARQPQSKKKRATFTITDQPHAKATGAGGTAATRAIFSDLTIARAGVAADIQKMNNNSSSFVFLLFNRKVVGEEVRYYPRVPSTKSKKFYLINGASNAKTDLKSFAPQVYKKLRHLIEVYILHLTVLINT